MEKLLWKDQIYKIDSVVIDDFMVATMSAIIATGYFEFFYDASMYVAGYFNDVGISYFFSYPYCYYSMTAT